MKVRGLARGGSIFGGNCVRPVFYPSVSRFREIAQLGWFRGGEAAPSQHEHNAQAQFERACTSTGRSLQTESFLPFQGFQSVCSLVVEPLRTNNRLGNS